MKIKKNISIILADLVYEQIMKYQQYVHGCLFGFYGISIYVGYLILNPVIYIYIYDL